MEITKNLAFSKLPIRPKDANKGTFGKALIIAGSKNYPGAAILSVLGAARSGVGLVTLATDEETYRVVVPKIPFATFLNLEKVKENIEEYDAVLIGPGLGQSEEAKKLIGELVKLEKLDEKKTVLDADALNILSENDDWYKTLSADAVLTPHPGEMSRLTKLSIDEIQGNREEVLKKFAKEWNKTIILKGAGTLISNPKGQTYKSEFVNPLLATAGTGDVLSGVIVGLFAQGLNLIDASIIGVYIHGLAGEKLKDKFGDRGMVATDLIEQIPELFKDLQSS